MVRYVVRDGRVIDTKDKVAIAEFMDATKAEQYVEILNAQSNSVAVILRQISEEVDAHS